MAVPRHIGRLFRFVRDYDVKSVQSTALALSPLEGICVPLLQDCNSIKRLETGRLLIAFGFLGTLFYNPFVFATR